MGFRILMNFSYAVELAIETLGTENRFPVGLHIYNLPFS
jgi:hypothetical protein